MTRHIRQTRIVGKIAMLAVLLATGWSQVAEAAAGCLHRPAPRAEIMSLLSAVGETQQDWKLGDTGVLIELFANPETGSWSVLWTSPSGESCAVDLGFGWRRPPVVLGNAAGLAILWAIW